MRQLEQIAGVPVAATHHSLNVFVERGIVEIDEPTHLDGVLIDP